MVNPAISWKGILREGTCMSKGIEVWEYRVFSGTLSNQVAGKPDPKNRKRKRGKEELMNIL